MWANVPASRHQASGLLPEAVVRRWIELSRFTPCTAAVVLVALAALHPHRYRTCLKDFMKSTMLAWDEDRFLRNPEYSLGGGWCS